MAPPANIPDAPTGWTDAPLLRYGYKEEVWLTLDIDDDRAFWAVHIGDRAEPHITGEHWNGDPVRLTGFVPSSAGLPWINLVEVFFWPTREDNWKFRADFAGKRQRPEGKKSFTFSPTSDQRKFSQRLRIFVDSEDRG